MKRTAALLLLLVFLLAGCGKNTEAQIFYGRHIYTHFGSTAAELPENARTLGKLEYILDKPSEMPDMIYKGVGVDEKYLNQSLWISGSDLYLMDAEGFYLIFEGDGSDGPAADAGQPRVLAEIFHGDFDRDGNEDYIHAYYIPATDSLCIQLVDTVTGSIRWSEEMCVASGGQKCFLRQIDNAYNDYLVRCAYYPEENTLYCTRFFISGGKEQVAEQWQSELVLPEGVSEARILDALCYALPQHSVMLMNTIGGITVYGPVSTVYMDSYPVKGEVEPEAMALLGEIAEAKAQSVLKYYSAKPGGITDYEITELDYATSYEADNGRQVDLYYFSFTLTAEEPDKVDLGDYPQLTDNILWGFGERFIAVEQSEGLISRFAYIGSELPVNPDDLSEMGMESIESAMQPYPQDIS